MKKYKAWINGKELVVRQAIASAMPVNKIWDGNQRSPSQAEEIYYVSADVCGSAQIEIEVDNDFNNFEIRPRSYDLSPHRYGNKITLSVDRPMQFVIETDGQSGALHVFINPEGKLADDVNLIYFGKGEHKVDLLWLKSGQTVYIDEGATVYGVIYAKDADNIKIMGRGAIDSSLYRRGNDVGKGGQEIAEALRLKGFSEIDLKYYGNIVINNCKNVLIEGVVLRDAPLWSLIIRNNSENVTVDNIKIIGQWRYNSDGIDICTSKNVTVKNCFVRSFDDCIVARGAYLEGEDGDVSNLTVENCVLWCDWGKSVEVWCGHKPTRISNITFKDLYLIHLSATALNITTWYGSESSVIDGVRYKNIYVDLDRKYNGLIIENEHYKGYNPALDFIPRLISISIEKIGKMVDLGSQSIEKLDDYSFFNVYYGNISFDNVKCIGEGENLPVFIEEWQRIHKIENITARNCDFIIDIKKKEDTV